MACKFSPQWGHETLEGFDFECLPNLNRALGAQSGHHALHPGEIAGPCGSGKSHLAQAVGNFERQMQALARADLLIVDDFWLKPLRPLAER